MADDRQSEVTTLLGEIRAGNTDARNQLFMLVYQELHERAAELMRKERAGHTLQPTALVHEAFVRLVSPEALTQARSRGHFFAAAAQAMRRVLVDHARKRAADKRGGEREQVALDEALDTAAGPNLDVLAVDDALRQLSALHERQSQVVELRYFGGCTLEEIADHLEVSVRTVERDFRLATAYLRSRLAADH